MIPGMRRSGRLRIRGGSMAVAGYLLVLVGGLLTLLGFASFFASFMYGYFPTYFWLVFVGPLVSSFGRQIVRRAQSRQARGGLRKSIEEEAREAEEAARVKQERAHKRIEMVRCHECDAENPSGSSKCSNCNASFYGKKRCPLCYKLNDQGVKFCTNCGHNFDLDI